jgi:hypothetical protein
MARLIPGKEGFDLNTIQGLSEEEVRKEGYNELPSSKQRSVLAIAFEVVRDDILVLAEGDRLPDCWHISGWKFLR